MPREPYGYAHVKNKAGTGGAAKPVDRPAVVPVQAGRDALGSRRLAKSLSAVSLYPEPRLYGENLKFGDTFEAPLAPYETVVLSIGPLATTPRYPAGVGRHWQTSGRQRLQASVAACPRPKSTAKPQQAGGPTTAALRLTCKPESV